MKEETWTGAPEGLSGHHIADEVASRSSGSSLPPIRHPFEDFDRIICRELPMYEYLWGDVERALNGNDYSHKLVARIRSDDDFRNRLNTIVTVRQEALNEFTRLVRDLR